MAFEVVGYAPNGAPLYAETSGGDVMGDVMGDYNLEGDYNLGAAPPAAAPHPALARHHHAHHGMHPHAMHGARAIKVPPRPGWRNQLAPGVIQPDEGMVPLPLAGQAGAPAGTFSATVPSITFQGQLQKPYRPERLLVSVVRTGTSAVGRLLTQLFVGTDLQQGEISGWDAELVGQPGSFGTRLTCKAAEPGVLVRTVITLSSVLTGTDTIFATMMFLGRIVH